MYRGEWGDNVRTTFKEQRTLEFGMAKTFKI